jgi:hypothetical protein
MAFTAKATPLPCQTVHFHYKLYAVKNPHKKNPRHNPVDDWTCKICCWGDYTERGKGCSSRKNLLEAERIFTFSVDTDNAYLRSVYAYPNNLYARWKKPKKTLEYRDKHLSLQAKQVNE